MGFREYSLLELANRLNLDYNNSGNLKCPFCEYPDPHRRNLHLNFDINFWRCNKCEAGGGVLHLFSQYVLHEPLPSSREGKREVREKLQEFMGDNKAASSPRDRIINERPKPPAIPIADDDHLHKVYSAMAKIPALQLTSAHRRALKSRGLSDEIIERNQYRSIPEEFDIPNFYEGMYKKEGGEILRNQLFSWYSPKRIKFGLMIAHALTSAGFDLKGVPGFFKFGEQWCLWCNNAGTLIPTRNFAGQIVGWQVRTKKVSNKYMTLSCGAYPGAVSENVSRCHIPLGNSKLGDASFVGYTEGPLKADVTCELIGKPVFLLAIPGINNTKDLLNCLKKLKTNGILRVCNCLDMDRLTNPNVRKGNKKLKGEIAKLGVDVRDMYWGAKYAQNKLMTFECIARMRHVTYQIHPSMTVFDRLDIVSDALCQAGIDACRKVDSKGKEHLYYWEFETKGIDDYYSDLLDRQQNAIC